ncbi:hypothetical protein L914_14071 [Phytophthora nicotianae]|uniref:HECT domain-containing protein n=1 Tax=Phytophthora nicotianae TaxID=4792 RepID=W2MW45_PHYNI|nr:hypothetical protein L914_14071 [Phytophthora nicotianae]
MQRSEAWTTTGTGYEPRSTTSNATGRPDLRWGRLTFAQLRDEEFLAKQLRRIEITQGARRPGRSAQTEAVTLNGLAPDKTIRQRLLAAQTKAARGASEDEEFDAKEETTMDVTTDNEDRNERELTNALCVLGRLQQPELAVFMVTKLKQALGRVCAFPNPVYQAIALRRHLMKSMHEAVAAQHRHWKAAVQVNLSIAKCMENSLVRLEVPSEDPVGLSASLKPKEKVTREAALGIQVLVCLLNDLHDATVATLPQRREFLEDLLPLLCTMGFLALCPRRNIGNSSGVRGSVRSSSLDTDIAEFSEKIQRFLLDMCPRPITLPSTSPKLPAISCGHSEQDVIDRTNAVNGLIHLAAATGSTRDFLMVLRVLLGVNDYVSDMMKDQRLSSRSLLTSSVPSLTTVCTEELLPPLVNTSRDDELMRATRPDSSKSHTGSPRSKRETEILGDSAIQDTFKKKMLPKGIKAINSTATVNLAMHHRLLYSSPGNNLVTKQRTKDELKDALLMNASLSLDMSKMKETLTRDSIVTTRSETPVVTARCPKFKTLNIQSVLIELDRVKPCVLTQGKLTSSSSNDSTVFTEDEGEREVWSCGQNSYGELGHGDTTSRKSFERITSLQLKEIVQIGAGNEHTIALTADGKVLTCGYNDNGQCGQGGTARVSHLSEIPKMESSISQVHAYNGCEHTILVTMDGRAATCGYNYRGQLGHGNTTSESVPKIIRSLESKIVRLVSCSYYHTVMACEDGNQQHLYTFGRNDYGQLGHNDSIDRKTPQQVEALSDQQIVSVACGQYHTMVVSATGKAFAFGKNDYGQLGIESMENQLVPVQVRGGLERQECLEIRCGYYHTIVLCSGAHLFAFGRNDYGQLGLGRSNASSTANLQLQQQRFSNARLIEELEGKDIVRFACGCYHTIAVSDNGVMYVFGRNNHGQLGTGDTNERVYPFPIDDFVGKRVALVAAGFYHTIVLTGGREDDKNDQDSGNEKEDMSSSNGITHTTILSSPLVQELLDPGRPGFNGLDAGAEVPAIDPIDDDFRDEDRRNLSPSRPQTDSADALLVAVVILAQLDRLSQPFIPKPGSYSALQHPSMGVIEALTTSTTAPNSSFDASFAFDGSFESFAIHNCSATFESLAVLLKHLSTKKIEVSSQLASCLAPQSATPRRTTLQMYMMLASMRILQANLSQFLRSGMAKAVILLSPDTNSSNVMSWAKELERIRVAILQVRDVLLSLVDIKHRRNVCNVLESSPNEGENATRIAEEATATLMQGFELFFPCQCLQRQFCMHVMRELPRDNPEHSCGLLCRRDLWLIDTLPKSKTLLLEPLLRRMTEDQLIIRFLPLISAVFQPDQLVPQETEDVRTSLVTEVYQLLLERVAADYSRRLGDVVVRQLDSNPRPDSTLRALFDTLGALQKHLSSWAASVHEWTLKEDSLAYSVVGIEETIAAVVDRVFRVDEQDLDRVPVSWRCFIEFGLAALGQCCEVLGQVISTEAMPSPSHGYESVELGGDSLQNKILETVEHSIVGQFLPLLVVSLFEFSNNSLFAATLLPTLKNLLRLLDGFNQQDSAVHHAEKVFIENEASSINSRLPEKESNVTGNFQRKSVGNLLTARVEDTTGRKGATASDVTALPWHYRLEKELAVLAAEMAVTLIIGDPYFTYEGEYGSSKLSKRWLTSPLFRGGLNSKYLTQSINHTSTTRSKHSQVVQHTPFPAAISPLGLNTQPFSLILPPPSDNEDTIPIWQLPTDKNYGEIFRPDSVRRFLSSLQENDSLASKLCDWVRDCYAKKDPSYRMIIRQSQLSKASIHSENDTRIETACFAALLHHNMLGIQAYHFALGLGSRTENRSPPRSFVSLWQCVAQLRRRVAAKKTEIKNLPQKDSDLSSLDRISALQQTILDRCKLLLFLNIHEEQEHLNLQLDAGYIASYDPAFLVSASSTFNFSASSAKRHLHATYTDEKLPFLVAFSSSKWRKIRTILHTIIRWKSQATEFELHPSNHISQDVLAYILSDELVSSTRAIKNLLVDPCRRVSCSVRGLETLWELLTLVSFDSIQTDIVHQVSQVFVFQSKTSILARSHSVGYFYSSLQNETFSEFIGQLTELMTDKAAKLMEPGETDASCTFWIVIVLLSAWGIHFDAEQFEFVSDIGILRVIQEMTQTISTKNCDLNSEGTVSKDSIVGRSGGLNPSQLTMQKQLVRLEDTLWILFRYICVHFAVQNSSSGGDIYAPTFPVLSGVTQLLFSEAASISKRFLPLLVAEDSTKQIEDAPAIPVAVRRSFEVVTLPQRFSAQSKGATCTYDEMISPSESEPTTPMSPLLKPNEFSITTWLYINSQSTSHSRMDNNPFDVSNDLQDRQLVCIRAAGREISLYLLLVPESVDNWQLEVGILMDIDREGDAGELPIKGRMWERMVSKQVVPGGKWIHVAIVLEAVKLRLYLNGILDCQRSFTAQSTAIWAAGKVDLPIHFGRFPTSQTNASVSSAIGFLSRSFGIKGSSWDPGMNNNLEQKGGFRCFDGWLGHFRFHNRSLSPIHVRIVFDEKRSPSGLSSDVGDHSKVLELHALLILLCSSSEGIVHFSSQFSDWMKLIWGTFLGTNLAVVQQSALRVLCALLPLQHPHDASKALVQDEKIENLGFYSIEDIFVHQVVRMIGFCLTKCLQSSLDDSDATVVPWTLMVARGIHGNHFSLDIQDNTNQQTDLENDVEIRYQSSKRQSLMLANELNQLLQQLFRCSNDTWSQSIIRVTSNIAQNFSNSQTSEPEVRVLQFGKHTLQLAIVKCVESVGCFYFLAGGVEFLRPGMTVEMRGSRDFAQVLSLEYHASRSSQNPPETPSDTKSPQIDTLAYVHIDSRSEIQGGLKNGYESTWYERVFSSNVANNSSYSKVNIDELNPVEVTNLNWNDEANRGAIYDLSFNRYDHKVFNVLVGKAAEVVPVVYGAERTGVLDSDLISLNVGCLLLKILVQIAGSGAGVDELLSKRTLIEAITELAVSQNGNTEYETLYNVEKRVSALRREVYTALVELGKEGEAELATVFESKRGVSSAQSENMASLDGGELGFNTSRDTGHRSLLQTPTDIMPLNDGNLSDGEDEPANENWDPTQGEDQDDDEEEEDESLEDGDNDEDDEEDAEESRAEFVEELMLMGFPEDWCVLALKQTENDIVNASAWIVDNLEYLSKLQSTLDKERDKGRDSPRFDAEEDDVMPPDDAPNGNIDAVPLNPSITSTKSDFGSKGKCDSGVPPLNDKEMGRKLFAEMYFPFEDGGFLSNTKSRFMKSWRDDTIEMKAKAASSSQPIVDNKSDASRSPFEEDFQKEINQLDLKGLVQQLRDFEKTLSIMYARQCLVTLLNQASSSRLVPHLITYEQWFKLLKVVLLRGDQFAITSKNISTMRLQKLSVDEAFSKAFRYFIDHDGASVASAAFEFCLEELETAASGKAYEAVLWTQRELYRPDRTVLEEPGIEVVIWLLDALLAVPTRSSLSISTDFGKTILRRLRCCLGTTNLPLKFVVLRTISRLLKVVESIDKNVVNESQLVLQEFLNAAIIRHSRELSQGRLLFSQYLQGYIELLHVLQGFSGFSDLNISRTLTNAAATQDHSTKTEGFSLCFDRKRSRSSLLSFAEDNLSVSYSGNEVWKAACAVTSFSTGVHSWMVRIEKSSSPYLFVGIATRQANLDSFLGADDQSWGFIGDKALYYQRNRVRAYGETFTEGDCIGLRLDCEKGELSFSKNGVDLGVAFDNIVGEVCPAVAFYSRHQKISFVMDSCTSLSNISSTGEEESASVEDCLIACEIISNWVANRPMRGEMSAAALKMTAEWITGSMKYVTTRSGKSLWVDVTRGKCEQFGFYSDDKVRTPRGIGVVVGITGGRIWVEVDNEPGAWFFHPSKLRLVPSSTTNALSISTTSSTTENAPKPTENGSKVDKEDQLPQFTLSAEELVEFGEHSVWNIAVDREFLSVINDFCEVSRISPWNLTPTQLLKTIKEKAAVLELTSVANVLAMPVEKLEKMLVARFALLRFCNMYISRALPFFDLTWHYFLPDSNSLPCRLVSQCRGSLFVCVKNSLWTALMERTANSPKKSDDEYDYPEDLPQLRVNRLKAAAAKCHEGTVSSLFLSLFGQAFEELHFLPLRTLRMVYSHPMDDGQLRSFKVKFEGEGVDDYGGPYREFFSQFFAELQMLHVPENEDNTNASSDHSSNGGPSSTSLKLDPNVSVSACVLPFLMPSPNWRNGVGANREKFVLNGALVSRQTDDKKVSFSTEESAEEKRQLYCEMFYFFGQMIGICLRTRVCVRLDLAMSVWKQLVAEDESSPESALETLKEIDFVAYSLWKTLNGILDEFKRLNSKQCELEEQLEAMDLVFTTVLSDGRSIELCEDGANTAVVLTNLEEYVDSMLRARIQETQEVMNIVKQGLHSIMPVSALALLTWNELEKRMCGVAEVDVKLLQTNTEYDEDLSPNDEFIQRFWRVLESLEPEDKRAFLRFVWARSRLPLGSAQFHQKFKIQALASSGNGDGNSSSSSTSGGWMDSQMPKSHTCFFALQLPRYSSDDICRERLLYAVRNCVEMDGDFRLADTEMTGWTGISPTDQLRI